MSVTLTSAKRSMPPTPDKPPRVAFLGPAGTFTHAAARALFGLAVRYSEAPTIDAVFDAVQRHDADYGVVPIENSTEGSVTPAVDALISRDGICIRAEHVLDVTHCLMSVAGDLTRIERVYSHPQALGQCRQWLATHLAHAQLVQADSTAAAVREARGDASGAAIGSQLAAELYSIPVLRSRLQDVEGNSTRFVMLATEDAPRSGADKTTVAFAVPDKPGALLHVLEVFNDRGINLSRIESRPSRQRVWDYVFLADLSGHREDPDVYTACSILSERCPMFRILGSYPRHRTTNNS